MIRSPLNPGGREWLIEDARDAVLEAFDQFAKASQLPLPAGKEGATEGSTMSDTNRGPIHPRYGQPLGGKPITVDGVTFHPYRRGILMYISVSADGRIGVYNSSRTGTNYTCAVDGKTLSRSFRKFETAARAAIAALKSAA